MPPGDLLVRHGQYVCMWGAMFRSRGQTVVLSQRADWSDGLIRLLSVRCRCKKHYHCKFVFPDGGMYSSMLVYARRVVQEHAAYHDGYQSTLLVCAFEPEGNNDEKQQRETTTGNSNPTNTNSKGARYERASTELSSQTLPEQVNNNGARAAREQREKKNKSSSQASHPAQKLTR